MRLDSQQTDIRKYFPQSALSSGNFRRYLYGNIFSLLGIWIQRLAIGWHAWVLTESAFIVGLVSAVQFLPVIVLTPFFGVIVDRIRAQSGAVAMNVLMGVIALSLGIATLNGSITINLLIGLALLHGCILSFWSPTRLALIPDLVDRSLFQSSVAISAIVFNLSRFIGPGLAGFVIANWGIGWAYLINAITYLPVIASLVLLRIDHASKPVVQRRPYLTELREGIAYVRSDSVIHRAILLALVGAFCGRGILELMPAFAPLAFDGGSDALAMLMAAAGIGALIGSFAMSSPRQQQELSLLIAIGCVGVVASLAILGLATQFTVGVIAVLLLGMATTFVGVGSQSLVQLRVPDQLRGRVMSLWSLVGMGGPAIGSLLGGALLREFSVAHTTWLFAMTCLVLFIIVQRRVLRRRTI